MDVEARPEDSTNNVFGMAVARYILSTHKGDRLSSKEIDELVNRRFEELERVGMDPKHPRCEFQGPTLKELIHTCGLEQIDVAGASFFSAASISIWANDEGKMSDSGLKAVCHALNQNAKDPAAGVYAVMCLCGIADETPSELLGRIDDIKRAEIHAAADCLSGHALNTLYIASQALMESLFSYREDHNGENRAHGACDLLGLEDSICRSQKL